MNTFNLGLACVLLAATGAGFAADEPPAEKMSGMAQGDVVSPKKIEDLPKAERLPAKDAARLKSIGTKVFGIRWGEKLVAVSDHGFQAVTDGTTTVSYRPAGNAYFVQEGKGRSGKSAFRGTDQQLIERGRTILAGLGINRTEIADTKILQQYVTEGKMNPDTRQLEVKPPRKDRRSLIVRRVVGGIPVLNSRLALDLDGEGKIAALEVSWPVIEPKVLEEARRLQKIAGAEYKAPERKGARVESVQAAILHSPGASFVEDQVAAIQVIYAPTESRLGMKPVAYLGVDGRPVAIPRQMIAKAETPTGGRPVSDDTKKSQ